MGKTLALTLGTSASPGLVLTGGNLTSLNATASATNWTIAGGIFNATTVSTRYTSGTNDVLAVYGAASEVFGTGTTAKTLSLTLGSNASPGLVLTNNTLSSLNATASATGWTVGGGAFDAPTITATYSSSGDVLSVSGSATEVFSGGKTLGLTLGSAASPGLTLSGGSLSSLNATAMASYWTVAGGTFNAAGTTQYTASGDVLKVSGTASEVFSGYKTLALTLGNADSPGLVLSGGNLTSLNATALATNWAVAGGYLNASGNATYSSSPEKFSLYGNATETFSGNKTLALTLGNSASPGLVLTNNTLSSLNASASATNWNIAGGTFNATGTTQYDSAGDTLKISGSASDVFGAGKTLALTLGNADSPGLVLTGGNLTSLNATGTATNWSISGTTFNAPSVAVTYAAAAGVNPEKLTVTGLASLSQSDIGSLSVTLGTAASGSNPGTTGLVMSYGQVTSLDMTLNSNITTGGLTFATNSLRMVYASAGGTFIMTGASSFALGSSNVNVTFGGSDTANGTTTTTAGLIVTNGSLTSLDMTVNSSISVGSLSFNANHLRFQYDTSNGNQVFKMTGASSFTATGMGTVSVLFGSLANGSNLATSGLVVTNGSLTSLDMTLNTDISVSSVRLTTTGLRFTYLAANSQFTLAGYSSASVGGMGTFNVMFGHLNAATSTYDPGLVVQNGSLVNLDMTVNSHVGVGSVDFNLCGLEFTYAQSNQTFTMTGSAAITVGGIAGLSAAFGHSTTVNGVTTTTPGLIITSGNLQSLDLTVNAGFNVSMVAFGVQDLEFTYQNLSQVPAGGYSGSGVYTGAYSTASYSASNYQFSMSGSAYVTVHGIDAALSVNFGHNRNGVVTPGLTINSGNLESLDVSLTADFAVSKVKFGVQDLEFTYQNLSQLTTGYPYTGSGVYTHAYDTSKTYNANNYQFMMSGSAFVTIGGMGDISVSFGHNRNGVVTPGLTINNGNLESLDVTVTAAFTVSKVQFGVQDLEFTYQNLSQLTTGYPYAGSGVYTNAYDTSKTYNANNYQFMMSGSAFVTIGGIGDISVSFGHNPNGVVTPGLTINSGNLESLDVTITADFTVSKVQFGVQDLEFTYQNLSQISSPPYAGTGVYTNTYDTIRTYDINNYQFMMSGSAFVNITGMGQLSVIMGHNRNGVVTPGLTINNGNLESIDVTVNAQFAIQGVIFGVCDLEFTYQNLSQISSPPYAGTGVYTNAYDTSKTYNINNYQFMMSGSAFVNIEGMGQLSVTFGHSRGGVVSPGLTINNGNLESIDVTVNAGFGVKGVQFGVQDLEFTYQNTSQLTTGQPYNYDGIYTHAYDSTKTYHPENYVFTMSGNTYVTFLGINGLSVTFGHNNADGTRTPGLVVTNGTLTSMDMTVNAGFSVGAVSFGLCNLEFTYSNANGGTYSLAGNAYVNILEVSQFNVTFGHANGNGTYSPGLVITNGTLTSLDLTISSSFTFAGYTLAQSSLEFQYLHSTDTYTILGSASMNLGFANVSVSANGSTGGSGIVITHGVVQSFSFVVNSDFGYAGVNIAHGNMLIDYNRSGQTFAITGSGSMSLSISTLTITLGGNGKAGLLMSNGTVRSFDFTVSNTFGAYGTTFGSVSFEASYANSAYTFSGTASIGLSGAPDWVRTFMGGNTTLGTLSAMIHVDTNHLSDNTSYVQFWSDIAGEEVGISVGFGGAFNITMGDGISGTLQQFAQDVNKAYLQTAAALSDAYSAAANDVTGVYNITLDTLDTAYNTAQAAIAEAARLEAEAEAAAEAALEAAAQAAAEAAAAAQAALDAARNAANSAANSIRRGWRKVFNFHIDGANVFYDPEMSGVYVSGNPSATTDAAGAFTLNLPTNPTGQLVGYGGTVTATNILNPARFTAPYDSQMVSSLTTLVTLQLQTQGVSEATAIATIDAGLGIPTTYNLLTASTMNDAYYSANATAAHAYAAEVNTYILALDTAALISGRAGAPDTTTLMTYAFQRLSSAITSANGNAINLGDPDFVNVLIRSVATSAGLTLDNSLSFSAATVIARLMDGIATLPQPTSDDAVTYLQGVAQYQTLAMGTLASQLTAAASAWTDSDSSSITNLVNAETTTALVTQATATTIGNLVPPVIIVNGVDSPVSDAINTLTFDVWVIGTPSTLQPITLNYFTTDSTAVSTPNGDYTSIQGTLTWAPGHTEKQTITVPIAVGNTVAQQKQFLLNLIPTNAIMANKVAIGTIDFASFTTTTILQASTLSTVAFNPVTLTAHCVLNDGHNTSAPGTVSFYDGITLLAKVPLDASGNASYSTTALVAGSHTIKAVFDNFDVPGKKLDLSESAAINLTVTKASQAISFNSINNITYGASNIILQATTTNLGIVTYQVSSGPAIISNGNILNITGAGTVLVEADQAGDDYYDAVLATQTFTVSKATLTVTVDNQSIVYGQAISTPTQTVSGFVNGESAADLTTLPTPRIAPTGSGAGTYDITSSSGAASNYSFIYMPATLTIAQAPLTVTVDPQTMTYGSTLPGLTYSISGFVNGETAVTLTTGPTLGTVAATSNAGLYNISASGVTDPNYNMIYVPGTLTITPAFLTITANSASITYGNALPTFTVSYSGLVNSDSASSLDQAPTVVRNSARKNAGGYNLTPSGAMDPNYSIRYVPGTLTIQQAPLTITANDATAVYGMPLPAFTATYTGFVNGDTVDYLTQQPIFSVNASLPGSSAISVSGAIDPNYSISYVSGTLTVTQTQSVVNLTTSNASPTIGDSITLLALVSTTLGTSLTTGTLQFQVDGVDVGSPSSLNASGVATITLNTLSAGSHQIGAIYLSGNASILDSSSTLQQTICGMGTTTTEVLAQGTAIYGQGVSFAAMVQAYTAIAGSKPTGTVQFSVDGTQVGAPVTITSAASAVSQILNSLSAGTHSVLANYTSDTLTYLNSSQIISIQIERADQAMQFSTPATVGFGHVPITLNGTASSSLPVEYIVVSGAATISDGKLLTINGAGAVVLQASQPGNQNYKPASDVVTTLEVTAAPTTTTVTSSAASTVYGQPATFTTHVASSLDDTFNLSGTVQFQIDGVNHDNPLVLDHGIATMVAPSNLTAGSHSVTATYIPSANFAGSSSVSVTQLVTPAPLTITVSNATRVYGASDSPISVTYSGLVNGEASSALGGTLSFTVSKPASTGVGSYAAAISASGLTSTNYDITYVGGSLTITPKALTASILGTPTKVYDGTNQATLSIAKVSLEGLVGVDSFDIIQVSGLYDSKNASTSSTVTATLDESNFQAANGTLASNYTLPTLATGVGAISPCLLTITFTAQDQTYDGTTRVVALSTTDNRFIGDSLYPSYTAASFATKNAGTGKTVTITGIALNGTDANNYLVSATAITLGNITPRSLTVTPTAVDKVYDGTTVATVTLADNRVEGDSLSISETSASFEDKNAGQAKTVTVNGLSVSGADAVNYSVAHTPSTTANISQRPLAMTPVVSDKVYDGTTAATVTLTDNRIAGDRINVFCGVSFVDKNAGANKPIALNDIQLSGADALNYSVSNTTTATASIARRALAVFATASNKVYDGTTAAMVTLTDNRLAGDVLAAASSTARFADKNAGLGKPVNVSGITISGPDSGNYSPNSSASTSASISPKAILVSAQASDKVYDGSTAATVTLTDNRVSGDSLTLSNTIASFEDKNANLYKVVNVSGITVSGADAANYTANTTTSSVANVTRRNLTITATATDKSYDGGTSVTVNLADDRISGDQLSISDTASFADKNAGSNTLVTVVGITLFGADSANYSTSKSISTNASISKRALTVNANASDKVYDGTSRADVTFSDDRVNGDVLTTVASNASFADRNVGSIKPVSVSGISLRGTDAGNYTVNATASSSASISQRPLTVSPNASDKVYDGTTSVTVILADNRAIGDLLTLSYASAGFADANSGVNKMVNVTGLTITGASAANYTVNSSASTMATINLLVPGMVISVLPTSPTTTDAVTFSAAVTMADGSPLTIGTIKFLVDGVDQGSILVNNSGSAQWTSSPMTAGVHDFTAVYTSANDSIQGTSQTLQQLVRGQGTTSTQVHVNGTMVYGQPIWFSASVLNQGSVNSSAIPTGQVQFSIDGNPIGNPVSVNSSGNASSSFTISPGAGHYVIGAAYNSNSASFENSSQSIDVVIDQASQTIHFDSLGSVNFGVQPIALAGTSSSGLDVAYQVISGPASIENNTLVISNSGTVIVEAIQPGDTNFLSATAVRSTLVVNTASTITSVSSSLVSSVYGQQVAFHAGVGSDASNGVTANGTVQFQIDGVSYGSPVALVNGSADINAPSSLTAGNHDITAIYSGSSLFVGSTSSRLTQVVSRASLTITASNVSRVYGAAEPALDVTYNGFVNNETASVLNGTLSTVDSRSATTTGKGGYVGAITATGLTASNYVITFVPGNLTVTPASLTITANDVARVYGAADPALSVTYTGFVNNELASVLGGTLSQVDSGSANTSAGTYAGAITASGQTSSNYDINYVAGSLTVTPAPLTITANNVTRVYGSSDPALDLTYSGFVNNETVSVLGGTLRKVDSKSASTSVGMYAGAITASGQTSPNYSITYVPGSLTITKAHLTVSAVVQTKTYDATGFAGLAATLTGFVNSETASNATTGTASLSGTALTGVNAGSYNLAPAIGSLAATNYDFNTFISGTLTITPKTLTAAIVGTINKVYDGTTNVTLTAANYSLTGFVGSQGLSVTKTTGTYASKNVGTGLTVSASLAAIDFTATAGTLASNYALPTKASGTGDITARALTVTFVGINKVYNGTTSVAALTLTDNRLVGDVLTDSYTTANFTDKNAGYKTINVSGISVSGKDAGNYTFKTTVSNPANNTQLAITPTIPVSTQVYDGTTNATIASYTLPGVASGDTVSLTGGTASFADKTAANGKAITVTGLALTGANATNYTMSATASATANITKAALTVTATGVNKVADGTTTAAVVLSDNRVNGDVFTDNYASASFASASVASNVAISVTGISISGTDAANYTVNTMVSTTANISAGVPAPAVVTQPAAQNVLPGTVASFGAAVSGTPTSTTWQVSSDYGTTWSTATGSVSSSITNGITTSTLSMTTALANNSQIYRAVFSNAAGSATTNTASLTVATATISSVGVQWGTKGMATLVANADGLRLLPTGRNNDIPWLNINRITVTLSRAVPSLAAGDIKLISAVVGTSYSVTSVSGSGTTWTITFVNNSTTSATAANGIINADRVTVTIGNGQVTTYARRLDVLPGDVNDDLAINSLDSAIVKNYYLVGIIPTQALTFLDIDGNGIVDVTDYNLITARVGKKLP